MVVGSALVCLVADGSWKMDPSVVFAVCDFSSFIASVHSIARLVYVGVEHYIHDFALREISKGLTGLDYQVSA